MKYKRNFKNKQVTAVISIILGIIMLIEPRMAVSLLGIYLIIVGVLEFL